MKSKIFLFLLLSLGFTMLSCGGSQSAPDDALKSIPNNISMLTAFDADAILQKADFEAVKQMAFYQELIQETKRYNTTLAEVLADPAQSGVDLSKNIYIAHHLYPDNPEEVFVAIVASVKDEAALEKLIQSNEKLKITAQDNFQVGMYRSQSVAWNGAQVILGMTNSYNDPIETIKKFFDGTPDNSIAMDKNLQKALAGKHDISSWVSSNALATNPTLTSSLSMAGIDPKAAKDNFVHSYVDFNKGAIESRSDLYLQAALMEDINLLFKDKLRTDFSKQIPANANSIMTVSLDLEGIQSLLQKKNALAMANFGLQEYGLTVEDIAGTFNGDILLYATPGKTEAPYGTFAAKINSDEKLEKFIALASDYQLLNKLGDNLYSINGTSIISGNGFNGPDAQLLIKEDLVVISADPSNIEQIAAGGYSGAQQIDKSKIKTLRGNILAGFVDLDATLKAASEKDLNLDIEGMDFTTNRKNGTFDMQFKDKNSNGLKQLFESINKIYLADKQDAM